MYVMQNECRIGPNKYIILGCADGSSFKVLFPRMKEWKEFFSGTVKDNNNIREDGKILW
jgi:4'-phosphopantetheinyl transferase EntD